MSELECPSCGSAVVPAAKDGHMLRCRGCNRAFTIKQGDDPKKKKR